LTEVCIAADHTCFAPETTYQSATNMIELKQRVHQVRLAGLYGAG